MPRRIPFFLLFILLYACTAPAQDATPTLSAGTILTATLPPLPPTPTPTSTATATATLPPTPTPDATAQIEAKKAEILSRVSNQLNSSADFTRLLEMYNNNPLDDEKDFKSGKISAEELWLIDNVLEPSNTKLPSSWQSNCNDDTGFCVMDWNHILEPKIDVYRGVSVFFVNHNGIKMLRIGVEIGGKDKLIHYNFQNPKWWTDPTYMNTLIAAFNRTKVQMEPITQYGNNNINWLTELNGYLIYSDASDSESYNKDVTLARSAGGNQFAKDWARGILPGGADTTVFGARFALLEE